MFPAFLLLRGEYMGKSKQTEMALWDKNTRYLWDSIRLEVLELMHKKRVDIRIVCYENNKKEKEVKV